MNKLQEILGLPEDRRARLGLLDTPREIAHQPEAWVKTAALVAGIAPDLAGFLQQPLVFSGAGTSHFIGLSLAGLFRRRGMHAEAVPSTEITVDATEALPPGRFGLVSFARSGNSPEGNHAFELVSRHRPEVRHLVITCNPEGTLYQLAGEKPGAVRLLLPAMTNDRGLAMTSSYTSMVVAGQGIALSGSAAYVSQVERMAAMGQRVLEDCPMVLAEVAGRRPARALFLGTGTLLGAATEAHLKVQEMTAGRTVARAESFLGLRHGPMAMIDPETVVVAFLSSGPARRRYELDLLREVRAKGLGACTVVVADSAEGLGSGLADVVVEVDPQAGSAPPLADDFRPPVYVVAAQLLALFLSLEAGLAPDTPSAGVINREVQGVTIYPD
ncbi:MAG TPA: SIS domain-containing protein [Symbiobacteriaceae bacterium]|nr:SIS domain-containing protein [Symbiobacteriaceae bacterium]